MNFNDMAGVLGLYIGIYLRRRPAYATQSRREYTPLSFWGGGGVTAQLMMLMYVEIGCLYELRVYYYMNLFCVNHSLLHAICSDVRWSECLAEVFYFVVHSNKKQVLDKST